MTFARHLSPKPGYVYVNTVGFAVRGALLRSLFSTATMTAQDRTYKNALRLLDSLQSNRSVTSAISNSSRDMNLDAIPEMLEWTCRAGLSVADFRERGLRCIHVAGTKGKGSVCIMLENLLMQYQSKAQQSARRSLGKIGVYTSPHLVTVRERIRIDGAPISEDLFTRYFFELWDRIADSAAASAQPTDDMPGYFRYLTLLAFHTFMEEKVESAIIECGIGGEYDSTNILPAETVTVTAITKLGIDHVGMLGNTIERIAWHKAGIMKDSVPAFTVFQRTEAQIVLEERASQKHVQLQVIERHPGLQNDDIELGMDGDFQRDNASLAMAVADSHLRSLGIATKSDSAAERVSLHFRRGLESTKWQGRCEVREDGNITWLIDGAHTEDSMIATAQWFTQRVLAAAKSSHHPIATMLIFNQADRDASALLRILLREIASCRERTNASIAYKSSYVNLDSGLLKSQQAGPEKVRSTSAVVFTCAAFCTNEAFQKDVGPDIKLDKQEATASAYALLDTESSHICCGSVEEAVGLARNLTEKNGVRLFVLTTGSLHLAGGLLRVLEQDSGVLETNS